MKSNAPFMVRGMDLGTSFVNALIKEARKRGVSDEDFYNAVKDGSPLVGKFADLIAETNQPKFPSCLLTVDYSVKPSLVSLEIESHPGRSDVFIYDIAKFERVPTLESGESYITGHENLKRLRVTGKTLLDVRVMEELLKHPNRIPEEWRTGYTYFRGTIFRDSFDTLYIPCLYREGDVWRWDRRWFDNAWRPKEFTACSANN